MRWCTLAFAIVLGVGAEARTPPAGMKAPKHAIALEVDDVTPTGTGTHVVFLTDSDNTRIVPIQVGESEAVAIAFRLAKRARPRPQTHDLLDEALRVLDAVPVQVHVHTLEDGVYHARVTVRRKRSLMHLDARASDGIAVALGHGLPIYMDQKIYDEASLAVDELLESLRQAKGPTAVPMTPDDEPL